MSNETEYLAFTDFETTGLDPDNQELLEVCVWVTDLELNILGKFWRVLRLTPNGLQLLQANQVVLSMHSASGLIADTVTAYSNVARVDRDLRDFLLNTAPGKISMAGSGTERFDLPWAQKKLPKTAALLTYYTYDIGVFRRISTLYNGGESVIEPVKESFQEGVKKHRAEADVAAHYAEFQRYREWFQASKIDVNL